MKSVRSLRVAFLTVASLLVLLASACSREAPPEGGIAAKGPALGNDQTAKKGDPAKNGGSAQKDFEDFDPQKFDDRSTHVDNEWFPLKPGMRYVWEGTTVDDEGDKEARRVVFTVTDLTKEMGGVRTVVCWDQDYADGELVETEIVFFAQDKDGTVWQLGEYPEEYEDGNFIKAPCWIHGIKESKAGIMMHAKPNLGTPSFSQGWAPSVGFTDRGVVYQTGQKVSVPFGSFDDVLVIDESNKQDPDAHHLKFYARGAGNVRVGWRGDEKAQESLSLIQLEKLTAEELAKAREEALKLEKRAYEISKDVYAKTKPSERLP